MWIGLKGTDDITVPVKGGEYIKEALIGRAVMDADIIISLSHFKGHENVGFGGRGGHCYVAASFMKVQFISGILCGCPGPA